MFWEKVLAGILVGLYVGMMYEEGKFSSDKSTVVKVIEIFVVAIFVAWLVSAETIFGVIMGLIVGVIGLIIKKKLKI